MAREHETGIHLIVRVLIVTTSLLVDSIVRGEEPVIRVGKNSLNGINTYLIRIERSKDGHFIDEPSLFAVNRQAQFRDFRMARDGDAVSIDTGSIRFDCSPAQMSASIRKGDAWVGWKPGMKSEGNLGGTIR